jgi:quinol-cytochrome oxidoreductase complex cytochrome b subunit
MILFILTLFLSFTGYLLPWDQSAFWAVKISTEIIGYIPLLGDSLKYLLLGAREVGADTLLRFYTLHVVVLPFLFMVFLGYHVWRIRKDRGLAVYEGENVLEDKSFLWPQFFLRTSAIFFLVFFLVFFLGVLFDADLDAPASISYVPNPAKAPWFFLWIQEMVSYSTLFGGVIVPFFIFILGLLVPYIDSSQVGVGVWFSPLRKRQNFIFSCFIFFILFLTLWAAFFRGKNWSLELSLP